MHRSIYICIDLSLIVDVLIHHLIFDWYIDPLFFFTLCCPNGIFSPWKIRVVSTTDSRNPTLINYKVHAGWVCSCFRDPPNSDMDYRIINVRAWSFVCTRGLGTPTAHHFWLGKTSVFLSCAHEAGGVQTSGLWISSPTHNMFDSENSHHFHFAPEGVQTSGLWISSPTHNMFDSENSHHFSLCSWRGSNLRSRDLGSDALPMSHPVTPIDYWLMDWSIIWLLVIWYNGRMNWCIMCLLMDWSIIWLLVIWYNGRMNWCIMCLLI